MCSCVLWYINHVIYTCLPLLLQRRLPLPVENKDVCSYNDRTQAVTAGQGNKSQTQDECPGSNQNKERGHWTRTIDCFSHAASACVPECSAGSRGGAGKKFIPEAKQTVKLTWGLAEKWWETGGSEGQGLTWYLLHRIPACLVFSRNRSCPTFSQCGGLSALLCTGLPMSYTKWSNLM